MTTSYSHGLIVVAVSGGLRNAVLLHGGFVAVIGFYLNIGKALQARCRQEFMASSKRHPPGKISERAAWH
jgi:hypothetical protein